MVHTTLQMFASRVQLALQLLSAANFVCNLCNNYLKLLQLFAAAVVWCNDSCKHLQNLQIKVAYLTTKVTCNHWLQQLHPECNWTCNTSKSCSFGNQNIYSVEPIFYCSVNFYADSDSLSIFFNGQKCLKKNSSNHSWQSRHKHCSNLSPSRCLQSERGTLTHKKCVVSILSMM